MSEDWQLEIDTTELRRALRTVIEHLEQTDGSMLRVPHDYFWSVPWDATYDVLVQPELTIGQLSESWDNLKSERAGVGDDTIGYAAVWLGDILKALGHSHAA